MEEASQTNGMNRTVHTSDTNQTVRIGEAFKVGELLDIEVTKITNFGAFVKLPFNKTGLIHISQITDGFVKDVNEHLKVGDRLKARVLSINGNGRIDLTLKKETQPASVMPQQKRSQFKNPAFEDKLKIFLKQSQERLADLKRREESKLGKKNLPR